MHVPVVKSVKDSVRVELRVAGPDRNPLRDPAGQRVQVNVAVGPGEIIATHHLKVYCRCFYQYLLDGLEPLRNIIS